MSWSSIGKCNLLKSGGHTSLPLVGDEVKLAEPVCRKNGTEEDAYLCPAEEKLKRYANVRSTSRVQYWAPKGRCVACAFRAECAPSGGERTMHRSSAQEFVEVNEERLASPLGKQRLAERQAYAEGPFGLAKELHGLRGRRFRGRRKVQIQLWLTAAAMNIKKAVRSTAASPELGGLPLLLASLAAFLSLGRWSLALLEPTVLAPAS